MLSQHGRCFLRRLVASLSHRRTVVSSPRLVVSLSYHCLTSSSSPRLVISLSQNCLLTIWLLATWISGVGLTLSSFTLQILFIYSFTQWTIKTIGEYDLIMVSIACATMQRRIMRMLNRYDTAATQGGRGLYQINDLCHGLLLFLDLALAHRATKQSTDSDPDWKWCCLLSWIESL